MNFSEPLMRIKYHPIILAGVAFSFPQLDTLAATRYNAIVH